MVTHKLFSIYIIRLLTFIPEREKISLFYFFAFTFILFFKLVDTTWIIQYVYCT